MRLIQLAGTAGRRVAIVEEPNLHLLSQVTSVYELATQCLREGAPLAQKADQLRSKETLPYDDVYLGKSQWRILPAVDHPSEAARCMVSGTGLTHKKSAQNRDAMHAAAQTVTDSTRMYQSGLEGGKPPANEPGVAPEWFYKGTGTVLRAHAEALVVPEYAEDGGEEPELAGIYIIDDAGRPHRIGFAIGNEFSDHVLERKNYLYLAASKLRTCSIGPELFIGDAPGLVRGSVAVERSGQVFWSREIQSGEDAMCHSLANIEHHHFKFDFHRRPGDAHIHFFGASAFSFGEGIRLEDGDVMQVSFDGFGRALRNKLKRVPMRSALQTVDKM